MTKREARHIALLVIHHEVEVSIDNSDEWFRHPETDVLLARGDVVKIKEEARRIAESFLASAERIRS